MDSYLIHYGVKGQKWGVRRFGRKKNITGNGNGVSKRGEGSEQDRLEVVMAMPADLMAIRLPAAIKHRRVYK